MAAEQQSVEVILQPHEFMQCLGMGIRILRQLLEEVEWLSRVEVWGQDDLLRHVLIAKEEVVEAFLLQAATQVAHDVLQPQQEISPALA